MNKVFLIGNLTKDPELTRTQQNGTMLCKFTLAITRNYAKDGKHETDFLPVTVWRAQVWEPSFPMERCGGVHRRRCGGAEIQMQYAEGIG